MGKTKYQEQWEKEFSWIEKVKTDCYSAFSKNRLQRFRIDSSGICQVRSHAMCLKNEKPSKQSTIAVGDDGVTLNKPDKYVLTPEDQVIKAEILQALSYVDNSYSFASAENNNNLLRAMFPDLSIAKSYEISSTKLQYIIKFRISPYVKEKLICDVKNSPHTFKFDETTNRQVQKQYDGYLQYCSNESNEIVNSYCGSLFSGYYTGKNLLDHYKTFTEKTNLDSSFLLHLGMDGPNVNLSFEEKLIGNLNWETGKHILKLGSFSLHPVYTTFRKGFLIFPLDFDSLFHDLHFYFKNSSARITKGWKNLQMQQQNLQKIMQIQDGYP